MDYLQIFETKYWKVTLHHDQGYLGRSFASLKRPCGDLADLTKNEWQDFAEVVKRLETALHKSFSATMFNWSCLMNNAYQNDPPDPQVHWHIRPRYRNSLKFVGIKFVDPEFGHHYNRDRILDVPRDVQEKIVAEIRGNL